MSEHGHGHEEGHLHDHDARRWSEPELRTRALESLLVEKGLVEPALLDELIDRYETRVGPHIGARVVARAWLDAAFHERLLADGSGTLAAEGVLGAQGEHVTVVANTPHVHNLVVCTLCSCYPWPLLGLPPAWYKSNAYRARAVREPRAVLAEFGLSLPDDVEVRVWDSTSDHRYLVLPERPAGTEGMDEAALAALVTRDSMVGVARVEAP